MTGAVDLFRCPVCGADLEDGGKSLVCRGARRHVFDFSSSHYVNLLPPGKAGNAHTGDDKSMIASRKRFLERGYFAPFSHRIGEIISDFASGAGKNRISFADLACGEGFHTCNIIKTIAENNIGVSAAAFDASKFGADYGARRAARENLADAVQFVAGNIFELPVKDGTVDFVTSIFAPIPWDEAKRVLRDDGVIIVASSGERHLFELRAALYDEPRRAHGVVNCPDGFEKIAEEVCTYTAAVKGNDDIIDLFRMTPFYYKTSQRDAGRLASLDALDVTVEVKLTSFRTVLASSRKKEKV